jgi:hypothetical protein
MAQLFYVLVTDCVRQTRYYPFMKQCFSGLDSLLGVPLQALFHQIDKTFIAVRS